MNGHKFYVNDCEQTLTSFPVRILINWEGGIESSLANPRFK